MTSKSQYYFGVYLLATELYRPYRIPSKAFDAGGSFETGGAV